MRALIAAFLAGTCLSAPALAAEEVVYADIPGWVQQADIAAVTGAEGPSERLFDWQYRIEDSVVHGYIDRVVRIDNPEALMEENQLSLSWLPDKGDLTVHRLEILRGGEVIDLLAGGATFDVIRREQGLEDRLIDGELTATLSVPGLRVGDALRTAFTVSTDDQALGDEAQVLQYLPAAPWQVQQARAIVSWPEDEQMFWGVEDRVTLPEPTLRDGYRYINVALPLAEAAPVPQDSPPRYQRPAILRVGSFATWEEVSRVMAPHFESAALLDAGSPIAEQARLIMARTADPLERTALAVRLVQDEVSYLLNGLDGGNYLPQRAEETWANRYGDCKAKSVLLLSLLRQMGITSEVVLVNTTGGDAMPELLPLPAFDHMIVHAVVGGQDYWLDGTSAATRMTNIGDVPPFFYALPLRAAGTGLMPMVQRDLAQPQFTLTGVSDHSAGIDFPMLVSADAVLSGAGGAQFRAMADEDNPQMLRELARNLNSGSMEGVQISAVTVDYDDEAALATIHFEGIAPSDFEFADGRLRMNLNDMSAYGQFNPDRARAAWRDIPVIMPGPGRMVLTTRMVLPDGGEGFVFDGDPLVDSGFGNLTVRASAALADGELVTRIETIQRLGEIAPVELAEAKRAARRLASYKLALTPPENITWRWELDDAERTRRAAPILAAYDRAIAFADAQDFGPLQGRALFNSSIFDFAASRADFDRLIALNPSAWAYQTRSAMAEALGDTEAAIADLRTAYDLEPFNSLAFSLARLLAYEGEGAEAVELLASLPVGEDEQTTFVDTLATVTGLEGDAESGLAVLAQRIEETPQNADVLNSDCWYRGLFAVALDSAVDRCTQAVERADYPAAALDSRALVRYRLGNWDDAIRDLDAALAISPGLAESMYLRGIVRLHNGDRAGAQDIATALRISPQLPALYARHGIVPPR